MRCFDSIATALMAGCRMVIGALALVASQVPATGEYLVAPGDVVEVVVTGTPDWRQRSPVGADGTISLPILGIIRIAGLSVSEMQARVEGVLATRMFRQRMPDGREQAVIIQPGDVSATIAEYRPVYVEGDVLNPGAHSYRPSLTVRQLVALSGGYSVLRRVLAPNRDPVELHGEYKLLRTLLAREQIHAQRLRAELEGREEFAPDVAKDALVPSSALNETIQSESDALRTRRAELSQERAFLNRAIKQADDQTAVLTTQQESESRGLEADSEELDRARKLFGAGNLPSPRVSEIRRAVLFSATRRLQTTVELIQIRKQKEELARRLEKVANDYKANLLHEMAESSVKLAELGSKLDVVGLKLGFLNRAPGSSLAGEPVRPEITVVRKGGQNWTRSRAHEDSELEPGDVVNVTFRAEDFPAGMIAR